MTRSVNNCWLHRFAVITAAAGLCLICVGGLVTSHGVGMSVPDWPTTYGYNMFFFPFSKWIGGIFYENGKKRSEEHTSELQSLTNLVCRLLLEKKKKTDT